MVITHKVKSLKSFVLSLLETRAPRIIIVFRLLFSWVFIQLGVYKFSDLAKYGTSYFAERGIPWPAFTVPVFGALDIGCGLLLLLGLGTRFAAFFLLLDVAITMIPLLFKISGLYLWRELMIVFLFILNWTIVLVQGGGPWSVDAWLYSRLKSEPTRQDGRIK
jgi:uncharacterized membrane protein YphA (DoxX/SURF4 family)